MSPMNNRRMVPTQEPGILDFAPGAAAAYSLRNLSLSYAGPVVTVRRSTDDAETDFTANEVSDGTLAAWCVGGDGFVKQWWDQSGNARHATQATTTAQPQIIDSGVLVTEGGKAAVRFDGVDDWLNAGACAYIGTGPVSVATVCRISPATAFTNWSAWYMGSSATNDNYLYLGANSAVSPYWYVQGRLVSGFARAYETSGRSILSALFITRVGSTVEVANLGAGGAPVASNEFTGNAVGQLAIGGFRNGTASFDGTISEIIVYESDQTALRTRIEGNLAWYY